MHRVEELWEKVRALGTIAGEAKDEGEIDEWQWIRLTDRVAEIAKELERDVAPLPPLVIPDPHLPRDGCDAERPDRSGKAPG